VHPLTIPGGHRGPLNPPVLVVYDAPEAVDLPVGLAHPAGTVELRSVLMTSFRLMVGKREVEGRYVCEGRRFVRIDGTEPGDSLAN